MLKSGIGTIVILLSLAVYVHAEQKTKPKAASISHEGTCILNDSAPRSGDSSKFQFICYSRKKLVNYRCDLSGEGSNVQIGKLQTDGKIFFSAAENNGNEGWFTCSKE